MQLLTEIDTRQHGNEDGANLVAKIYLPDDYQGDFNPVNYHPQYWQINGLSFPNTIHVGLPEHRLQLDRLDRGSPRIRPVRHREREQDPHEHR